MSRLLPRLLWPLLFIGQTLALALFSWHLLAQVHFGYPLGYALLGLEQHIAEYAPLNRHKAGFEQVSAAEHQRLFGAISDAVQRGGRGLGHIQYQANGEQIALMHQAEIIHLQDVADLIDRFYATALLGLLVWLAALAYVYWRGWPLPAPKRVLCGFAGGLSLLTVVILLLGPTKVFYWLHVQIFPDEHQWFFYYEDSLMTTLMKAPDIFAFISVLLLSLLIALWGAAFTAMKWALAQRQAALQTPIASSNKAPAKTTQRTAKKNKR